jgi:hypothetical protein
MNARTVFAALAFATAGSAAFAIEATQVDDAVSTLTREEVRAELIRAQQEEPFLMSGGEATVFVDRKVATAGRSREEVRAEAYAAARDHSDDMNYGG